MPKAPVIPDEVVALIRGIYNQDRRERRAGGFLKGTYGLTERIAKTLGLKFDTVREIRKYRRRAHVHASRALQRQVTVEPERLEKVRKHLRRSRSNPAATE